MAAASPSSSLSTPPPRICSIPNSSAHPPRQYLAARSSIQRVLALPTVHYHKAASWNRTATFVSSYTNSSLSDRCYSMRGERCTIPRRRRLSLYSGRQRTSYDHLLVFYAIIRRQFSWCSSQSRQIIIMHHSSPNQWHLQPSIYAMIIPPSIEQRQCITPTSFVVSSHVVTTSSFILFNDTT